MTREEAAKAVGFETYDVPFVGKVERSKACIYLANTVSFIAGYSGDNGSIAKGAASAVASHIAATAMRDNGTGPAGQLVSGLVVGGVVSSMLK